MIVRVIVHLPGVLASTVARELAMSQAVVIAAPVVDAHRREALAAERRERTRQQWQGVDVSDVDLLREAARLMRERAEAADTGERWEHEKRYDALRTVFFRPSQGDEDLDGFDMPAVVVAGRPQAEYIASWHPAVALAVADWLEQAAEQPTLIAFSTPEFDEGAIAVARTYLGET